MTSANLRRIATLIAPAAVIGVFLAAFLVINNHLRSDQSSIPTTTTTITDGSNQSAAQVVSMGANSGSHVSGAVLLGIVVVAALIAVLSLMRRTETVAKTNPFRRNRIVDTQRDEDQSLPKGPPAKRWIADFNRYVAEHPDSDIGPSTPAPGSKGPSTGS